MNNFRLSLFWLAIVLPLIANGGAKPGPQRTKGKTYTVQRSFIDRTAPLEIPNGWKVLQEASEDHRVKLTLAIKQRNVDTFMKIFWDVTDPRSRNYGKWLTIEDLTELMAPSDEVIDSLLAWLQQHGIQDWEVPLTKDFINIDVSVETAQRLLDTRYFVFHHAESDTHLVRSLGPYSAPIEVAQHLDFVIGSLGLPLKEPILKRSSATTVPVNPQILRERYNVTKTTIGGNMKNQQSVTAFMDNYYNPTDLDQFFNTWWYGQGFNTAVNRIVGINKPSAFTKQANADVQYMMGIAPNVPTWFWSNPGSDFWGDIVSWLNSMISTAEMPYVHMVSYGNEGDGPSQEYRDRVSLEFAELGGRGISVLVSAGDTGTGCEFCYYFKPTFPATSPFVTVVGATAFVDKKVGPEMSTVTFSSGGGFSWNFEQPAYQAAVVSHYFANMKVLPHPHYYNAYGRGFPDIAALGTGYQMIHSGLHVEVEGTAASTATVAAMVSLLNEIRFDHNKPPLGFLNPLLYLIAEKYPDSFFDITEGNNHYGCCGYSGFYATSGWDPVAGLGTPNYWILKTVVGHLEGVFQEQQEVKF